MKLKKPSKKKKKRKNLQRQKEKRKKETIFKERNREIKKPRSKEGK